MVLCTTVLHTEVSEGEMTLFDVDSSWHQVPFVQLAFSGLAERSNPHCLRHFTDTRKTLEHIYHAWLLDTLSYGRPWL